MMCWHCNLEAEVVRAAMPITGNPVFLCRDCFGKEMDRRRVFNRDNSPGLQYPVYEWDELISAKME